MELLRVDSQEQYECGTDKRGSTYVCTCKLHVVHVAPLVNWFIIKLQKAISIQHGSNVLLSCKHSVHQSYKTGISATLIDGESEVIKLSMACVSAPDFCERSIKVQLRML